MQMALVDHDTENQVNIHFNYNTLIKKKKHFGFTNLRFQCAPVLSVY